MKTLISIIKYSQRNTYNFDGIATLLEILDIVGRPGPQWWPPVSLIMVFLIFVFCWNNTCKSSFIVSFVVIYKNDLRYQKSHWPKINTRYLSITAYFELSTFKHYMNQERSREREREREREIDRERGREASIVLNLQPLC